MKKEKRDPRYPNSEDHQLTHTGHYTDIRDKNWNIRPEDSAKLSDPQKLVYKFLLTGWYSSREISLRTGYLDTRSIIRRIKKKGITVLERWYKRQNGEKFKKFTIPPKSAEPENTSGPKSIREIMDQHFTHLKRDGRDNNTQ
jgi:hypothetical protein